MSIELTPDERLWVQKKWLKVRVSQKKADAAANDWSRMNDALNTKIQVDQDRRREAGRILMTELEIVDIKSNNLTLKDALATHSWHAMEASRHLLDIQVFLQMKELGL